MRKSNLNYFLTVMSIAIASTASIGITSESANAQMEGEFIDSSIPYLVERISGNIVTFRGGNVEPRNYYVPNWMFDQYQLKEGSSVYLYNRNIIQGTYRDTYVETISNGLLNMRAFTISNTRRFCTMLDSPASEGLSWGSRIWYKSECCLSTMPVVGAMWLAQPARLVSFEPTVRTAPVIAPAVTPMPYVAPAPVMNAPVQGLW